MDIACLICIQRALTHALALHELHRAITCLFLPRGSRYKRCHITGNTEKVQGVLSTFLVVFLTIICFCTLNYRKLSNYCSYSSQLGVILPPACVSPAEWLKQFK